MDLSRVPPIDRVIDISDFQQGIRLPSNTSIHQLFDQYGPIEAVYHSLTKNRRHIFVVFDSVDSARAAVLIKNQQWNIASLVLSEQDVINDFKMIASKPPPSSRHHHETPSPVEHPVDPRFVADNGWASRRRASDVAPATNGTTRRPSPAPGPPGFRGPADSYTSRYDEYPASTIPAVRPRSPSAPDYRGSQMGPPRTADRDRISDVHPATGRDRRATDYSSLAYPDDRGLEFDRDRRRDPVLERERALRDSYAEDRYHTQGARLPSPVPQRRRHMAISPPPVDLDMQKRMRLNEPDSFGRPYASATTGSRDAPATRHPSDMDRYRSLEVDRRVSSGARFRSPPPPYVRDEYATMPRTVAVDPYMRPASSPSRSVREDMLYRGAVPREEYGYRYATSPPSSTRPLPSADPGYRSGPLPATDYASRPSRGSLSRADELDHNYPARVVDDRRLDPRHDPQVRRYTDPEPPRTEVRRYGSTMSSSSGVAFIDDRRLDTRDRDVRRIDPPGRGDRMDLDRPAFRDHRAPVSATSSFGARSGADYPGDIRDPRYREYDSRTDSRDNSNLSSRNDYRRPADDRDRISDFDRRRDSDRGREHGRDRVAVARDADRAHIRERDRERERVRHRELERAKEGDRTRDNRGRDLDREKEPIRRRSASRDRFPERSASGYENRQAFPSGYPSGTICIFVSNLPLLVSPRRLRKMFGDVVDDGNVLEINTGRAGFAFVRILGKERAEKAVDKLHHTEYSTRYRMNVCIGKPPSEYRKQKYEARAKRVSQANDTQPRSTAKGKKWQVSVKNNGSVEANANGGENKDSSEHDSDADGEEIGNGQAAEPTQEEIDAFLRGGQDPTRIYGSGPPSEADPTAVESIETEEPVASPSDQAAATTETVPSKPDNMHLDDDAEAKAVEQLHALEVEGAQKATVDPPECDAAGIAAAEQH